MQETGKSNDRHKVFCYEAGWESWAICIRTIAITSRKRSIRSITLCYGRLEMVEPRRQVAF